MSKWSGLDLGASRGAPEELGPAQWPTIPGFGGTSGNSPFRQSGGAGEAGAHGLQRIEEARKQGLAEGVAAAKAKLDGEVAGVFQRLADAITGVIQLRQQVKEDAAGEMVQLAIAIASRILHRELNVDPDAILGLVRAALHKAQAKEIHRIRLHPSHEALLRRTLGQLNAGGSIEIVPDAGMRPGDIIFETAQGHLDASVSTQLKEIERGLADRVSF